MTPKMKEALKSIWIKNNVDVYVHCSTAYALQDLGYVIVGKIPKKQATESGNFPRYVVTLTSEGKKYCSNNL